MSGKDKLVKTAVSVDKKIKSFGATGMDLFVISASEYNDKKFFDRQHRSRQFVKATDLVHVPNDLLLSYLVEKQTEETFI